MVNGNISIYLPSSFEIVPSFSISGSIVLSIFDEATSLIAHSKWNDTAMKVNAFCIWSSISFEIKKKRRANKSILVEGTRFYN
jgi:hypothetical protein